MKSIITYLAALLLTNSFVVTCLAKEITTNAVYMHNAPQWLSRVRVDKITDRIQMHMEWTIRRIHVYWHHSQEDFAKHHSFGPRARAITSKSQNTIRLGPQLNNKNFDQIFAHELVHGISFQKYKGVIPLWLEEGLANYFAKKKRVNYKWLAQQTFPKDVRQMVHKASTSRKKAQYHYIASQALAEMLAKKCDLNNLLRLSVERNMDTYIRNYCEISDLNTTFRKWVRAQSK